MASSIGHTDMPVAGRSPAAALPLVPAADACVETHRPLRSTYPAGTDVCTPVRFEHTSAGAATGEVAGAVVVGAGVADAGVQVLPAATYPAGTTVCRPSMFEQTSTGAAVVVGAGAAVVVVVGAGHGVVGRATEPTLVSFAPDVHTLLTEMEAVAAV